MGNRITIQVNGIRESLDEGQTVEALLAAKKLNPASIVVEFNAAIIPAQRYGSTILKNDDVVEILHFVGGG